MKVKSVSDLAFQVLDELTDESGELDVAHIVFDGQAIRTGDIQRIMKQDCGTPYYLVQKILKNLVAKELIFRVRQGVYAPNLSLILEHMQETLKTLNKED